MTTCLSPSDLAVTAAIDASVLKLKLALKNALDVDIYVEQYLPSFTWPPARAGYVYSHRDGLLLLYFGIVPNPPRTCLARQQKLLAELLPPNQTLRASIALPIPILERGKTRAPNPEAPHEVLSVSRLRIVISYARKQRGLKVREVVPKSGLYELSFGDHEKVEVSLVLPQPIAALRRSDDFDRPFEAAEPAPP